MGTYLPFVTVTNGLMFYKGYHVLLAIRAGEADMVRIDATLFAGSKRRSKCVALGGRKTLRPMPELPLTGSSPEDQVC
jgi:hypothetical protein